MEKPCGSGSSTNSIFIPADLYKAEHSERTESDLLSDVRVSRLSALFLMKCGEENGQICRTGLRETGRGRRQATAGVPLSRWRVHRIMHVVTNYLLTGIPAFFPKYIG